MAHFDSGSTAVLERPKPRGVPAAKPGLGILAAKPGLGILAAFVAVLVWQALAAGGTPDPLHKGIQ